MICKCLRRIYRGQHINLTDTLKHTTLAIVSKKNLDANGLICVISISTGSTKISVPNDIFGI